MPGHVYEGVLVPITYKTIAPRRNPCNHTNDDPESQLALFSQAHPPDRANNEPGNQLDLVVDMLAVRVADKLRTSGGIQAVPSTPPHAFVSCHKCGVMFNDHDGLRKHHKATPSYCPEHECCVKWDVHIRQKIHLRCDVANCHRQGYVWRRRDEFMEHYNKYHRGRVLIY